MITTQLTVANDFLTLSLNSFAKTENSAEHTWKCKELGEFRK
jgi:hypothetical protein